MKSIAFFGYNLEIGGAEKSLVNIINFLHHDYKIDLYLYEKKGPLIKELPSNINIFEIKRSKYMYTKFKYIKSYRKKIINKICNKKYDFLVAYLEGRLATLITEINQNCKKIAWIHTDVTKHNIGISYKEALDSYEKVDEIVFVSNDIKESFLNKYNISGNKTKVISNIINANEIIELSKEKRIEKKAFTFVNVSRMRNEKRHDLLIDACKILKDQGFKFQMWLVGDGENYTKIAQKVKELELESEVTLWGIQENPYPFIASADCFVLSSDYEGQSLVVLEALILKKPIISTQIPVVEKIIANNNCGIICEHNAKSLANEMVLMLNKKNFDEINKKVMTFKLNCDNLFKEVRDLFEYEAK